MAYRVIKITSALYRLWAGVRLRHMRPWVQGWDDPALLAGTQGRSAQDGWYSTALALEEATVAEEPGAEPHGIREPHLQTRAQRLCLEAATSQ